VSAPTFIAGWQSCHHCVTFVIETAAIRVLLSRRVEKSEENLQKTVLIGNTYGPKQGNTIAFFVRDKRDVKFNRFGASLAVYFVFATDCAKKCAKKTHTKRVLGLHIVAMDSILFSNKVY